MRTFQCSCGNRLFFDNSLCLSCGASLGWCPVCRCLSTLIPSDDGGLLCGSKACGARLQKCHNYAVEEVCNRCCEAAAGDPLPTLLCDSCQLTAVIPDLSIEGNRQRWYRLEVAKRRLLYLLDLLGLPYRPDSGVTPQLSFDFKADAIPANGVWRTMTDERIYTGHQDGKITINIREADDVEREKLRVDLGEAHRTLCGHFRHEIGHYYWQVLVQGAKQTEFCELFGDFEQPPYAEALDRYYQQGPPPDWQARFVSAYASMHPWEDFAETFATYLDMVAVLDTAVNSSLVSGFDVRESPFVEMLEAYQTLGLAANELNRSMGLVDLVPEVVSDAVSVKLEYVHRLIREAVQPEPSGPAPSGSTCAPEVSPPAEELHAATA